MQIRVIHNPKAGQRDVDAELERAVAHLRSLGWWVEICETHASGDATDLAREAAQAAYDMVVAVGGDGTIGEVVSGLVKTQCPMGVIPVGTGNVWAHMLGLPVWSPTNRTAIMDAANVLEDGEMRAVDVGLAGGKHFLLWAGIGFDAMVAKEVEPHREVRRSFGNIAYLLTALVQSLLLRGVRTTVIIDGQAIRQRLLMLVVSNAQLYGASWEIAPEAQLDDGLFDIYLFKGASTIDTFRHLALLMAGKHTQSHTIEAHRGKEIRIISDKPLPVHLDGDPSGATPIDVKVIPRALRVVVPTWTPNTLFEEGGFFPREQATLSDRITARLQEQLSQWRKGRDRIREEAARRLYRG